MRFLYFLGICLLYHPFFAQTGPGGVGNASNNVFWVKADAGTSSTTNNSPVSSWQDQSGNNVHMTQTVSTQQPSFATNIINGFPAILFDNINSNNQNDRLVGPDAAVLDNTSGYSFFTVTRPVNFGDARVVVSKRTTVGVNQSFMLFYYTSNRMFVDIQTNNDRFSSTTSYSANNNYIIDVFYDGTRANPRCALYNGETLNVTANETSTLVPDNNSPIILGSTDLGDSRPFGGYMSEVIIYREALPEPNRTIVNNYLSAKYNISLATNDKYQGDDPVNGNYDFEVAGIGRESTGSNTAFASSVTGGLGITAVSGLDNGDYLMVGHAVTTNSFNLLDVGGVSGLFNARSHRVWYVDVTNTLTPITANVEFDMSDAGLFLLPIGAPNYRLLYRAGQSGNWTEVAAGTSTSGNKVLFSSFTFTADGYYTIGLTFLFNPLPVELLSFTGVHHGDHVDLEWTTATETDNAFFDVERSNDGGNFVSVGREPGAGHSRTPKKYYYVDNQAPGNRVYYRLKQQDFSGVSKHSEVISVEQAGKTIGRPEVYPNPSDGRIRILLPDYYRNEVSIEIRSASGYLAYKEDFRVIASALLEISVDVSPGFYFISFSSGHHTSNQPLIIK